MPERARKSKTTGAASPPAVDAPATAKLFMHGRSQAVRLPKAFRFEGSEVRVSRQGDKVILEPLKRKPFDAEAFWARLDALGARDFPDVADEDLRPELDDKPSFD
jgi:antitoxin VapB